MVGVNVRTAVADGVPPRHLRVIWACLLLIMGENMLLINKILMAITHVCLLAPASPGRLQKQSLHDGNCCCCCVGGETLWILTDSANDAYE